MKILKSQLEQIIKEEIQQVRQMKEAEFYGETPEGELTDTEEEDARFQQQLEIENLLRGFQRLYDEWQPQTPEGQKYKDELGALMGSPGASAPPAAGASAGPDWPLSHEFE